MRLPNAENAVIDIAKLQDYCLNPNHPEGKHKARVFQRKLGIRRSHAEQLREVILQAILTEDALEQQSTVYGRRYVVDVAVSTIGRCGFHHRRRGRATNGGSTKEPSAGTNRVDHK